MTLRPGNFSEMSAHFTFALQREIRRASSVSFHGLLRLGNCLEMSANFTFALQREIRRASSDSFHGLPTWVEGPCLLVAPMTDSSLRMSLIFILMIETHWTWSPELLDSQPRRIRS